jgi:hypothetical protein
MRVLVARRLRVRKYLFLLNLLLFAQHDGIAGAGVDLRQSQLVYNAHTLLVSFITGD